MIENTIERADAALRFHTIKTDKFKMSRLSINFILPADADRSPKTCLMMATMMRGCEKYPSVVAINKRLDELYGATVTWRAATVGERHVFRISSEFISDKFRLPGDEESVVKGVCDVILDILFAPLRGENGLLSESNFESERGLAVDSIKSLINNQKAYAAEQCRRLMFEGHPLGFPVKGTVDQIEKMTLAEISENLEYFLKNSVIECYYVGDDNVDGVVDMISTKFAHLGRDGIALEGGERAFLREEGAEIKELEEQMNVTQGRLNIGCTCGIVMSDKERYAATLFNEIFGGSSVAKLFMNVREKKSLCYYCYSSYASATGTIMIACGIKSENRDVAYEEIKAQLSEMQKGNFSLEDIETAKRTLISSVTQTTDSPAALEAFRFRRFLAGIEESVSDVIEGLNSVKKEEIIAVAEKVRFDSVYFLSATEEEEECEDE